MTPEQQHELDKVINRIIGRCSMAKAIRVDITPDMAANIAEELEAARVAAGLPPIKLFHVKGNTP